MKGGNVTPTERYGKDGSQGQAQAALSSADTQDHLADLEYSHLCGLLLKTNSGCDAVALCKDLFVG